MEKQQFVVEWLRDSPTVDILNIDFVNAYIERFAPAHEETILGAYKCPELGRLLGTMARSGKLRRKTIGTKGLGYGFPNWVYVYSIS